jgi:hypothetical protein
MQMVSARWNCSHGFVKSRYEREVTSAFTFGTVKRNNRPYYVTVDHLMVPCPL